MASMKAALCSIALCFAGIYSVFAQTAMKSTDPAESHIFPVGPKSVPKDLLLTNTTDLDEKLKQNPPEWVIARPLNAAPGAVICSNVNDVITVFHLYSSSWEDHTAATLTHGQSAIVNGRPSDAPAPERFGCLVAKPGTWLQMRMSNGIPIVSAKLSNGARIVGVTLPAMFSKNDAAP